MPLRSREIRLCSISTTSFLVSANAKDGVGFFQEILGPQGPGKSRAVVAGGPQLAAAVEDFQVNDRLRVAAEDQWVRRGTAVLKTPKPDAAVLATGGEDRAVERNDDGFHRPFAERYG